MPEKQDFTIRLANATRRRDISDAHIRSNEVPHDATIIGEVPTHLRGISALIDELEHEVIRAQQALDLVETNLKTARSAFWGGMREHFPQEPVRSADRKSVGVSSALGIAQDWKVYVQEKDPNDIRSMFDEMNSDMPDGLGLLLSAGLGDALRRRRRGNGHDGPSLGDFSD